MTAVFMCQPLGQLAATLVALVAAARHRSSILADATVDNCTGECQKILDSVWRWIIGVGVIPAVIALWFRLTIIESPRYTADVGGDSRKAASELNRYLPGERELASSSSSSSVSIEDIPINQRTIQSIASNDSNTLRDPSGINSLGQTQINNDLENTPSGDIDENKAPPMPSWADFRDYFWHNGNIRTLMATSLCWFFVDL
jgi:PHS family inorganic phosphate transporter-like MFS transporter